MSKHEDARQERRRSMARNSMREFEDKLSEQELLLVRLDALPAELQEPGHEETRDKAAADIERAKLMIAAMRDEGGGEAATNRAQRRAAK